MTAPVNVPFGATAAWFAVVERRAGLRCECTGQCGVGHSKTKFRCPVKHQGWHNKKTAVLTVAPKEPLTSLLAAVKLPNAELMAWCDGCWMAAKRRATVAAENAPFEVDGLFGVPAAGSEDA